MRGLSGENGIAEDIVESIKQKDQARFYMFITFLYNFIAISNWLPLFI